MTWSLVARDHATGAFGIAVATRFFAVGALVPHIDPAAGAIATQALVNPYYGIDGLALLRQGLSAAETLARLLAADEGRESRQVHLIDRQGRSAVHTGKACVDWCGHLVRDGFSVAGNMLAGEAVIADSAAAFARSAGKPLAERFLLALEAGEAAGGDKRGKQSAALLVHDDQDYSLLDLRVDDHTDPLAEIARLESVARARWVHFRRFMPTRAQPSGLVDRSTLDAQIQASIAEGYE